MLRDYQLSLKAGVYQAWNEGARNVLAVAPTGAGKCLGRDTPVLMFDGTIRAVQHVRTGDVLMGPDSHPRRVVSTCQGIGRLYRVIPTKGESYIVNDAHILSLKRTRDRAHGSIGHIVNMNVEQFATANKWTRHVLKGWRTGVEFSTPVALPLDPYILGLWLAEGTTNSTEITTPDVEIKQAVCEFARANGYGSSVRQGRSCETINITNHKLRSGGFRHILQHLGTFKSKHVPHIYKKASRAARLQLLAGFLDGDGYLTNGSFDTICAGTELADDIAFIARSLGFACYKKFCVKRIKSSGFEAGYLRLSISGDVSKIPCRVPRRQAAPRRQKKDVLVTGLRIEPLGIGEYFGFELSGPNGLFLLGDFTVTHNTKIKAAIFSEFRQPSVAIAHRQELVGQISLAMAEAGVYHRIIAPDTIRSFCISKHVSKFGRSFHHAQSPIAVGGVDTINARSDSLAQWLNMVRLWDIDEAHHVLTANKWGKAVALFTNAVGVGFTATPVRTDKRGLGRHASGVFDRLVIGPTMRELINPGFLAEYRIFVPPASYVMTDDDVSATTGDYKPERLRAASHASTITGDIVDHYLRFAPGKRGITFTVDVETANEVAAAFLARGVPAAAVSAKTPDKIRDAVISKFARGDLRQLVNVDIFGEGFDVPAVEVVSDGAGTKSFSRYAQRFGRALRPADGKTHGMYIDHVGNVKMHGLHDKVRVWSLDDEERRKRSTEREIPVAVCPSCFQAYEAVTNRCPYCGHKPEPAGRSSPEFVDGDLIELDPATLAKLRGEIDFTDSRGPNIPYGADAATTMRLRRLWGERQDAQKELRDVMAYWAGIGRELHGWSDSELYRRFYFTFGVDVLTAQTLGRAEAEKLTALIREGWI